MPNFLEKKNVKKVKEFLKLNIEEIDLINLDTTGRTAEDAANSLNQSVGSIVKSLILKLNNNNFILCLVSGDKFISLKILSKLLKSEIYKANADEVKKITGYSIGGVPPFAHINKPFKTLIDINLKKYQNVFAAAGHPYVVFQISYDNLKLITNGEEANFTE